MIIYKGKKYVVFGKFGNRNLGIDEGNSRQPEMISGGSPPNGNGGILRRQQRRKRKRRWWWQPWQLVVSSSSVTSLGGTGRSNDGDDGAGNHSGVAGLLVIRRQRLDLGLCFALRMMLCRLR